MDQERLERLLLEPLRSAHPSQAHRYFIRFLLDEEGTPWSLNDMTVVALQGVGALGHLEALAQKGDERAAAFVTRLRSYLDRLHEPITANRSLTPDEQALYDEFRRETSHANAYYHICGRPRPVPATMSTPAQPSEEAQVARYRRIIHDALTSRHNNRN